MKGHLFLQSGIAQMDRVEKFKCTFYIRLECYTWLFHLRSDEASLSSFFVINWLVSSLAFSLSLSPPFSMALKRSFCRDLWVKRKHWKNVICQVGSTCPDIFHHWCWIWWLERISSFLSLSQKYKSFHSSCSILTPRSDDVSIKWKQHSYTCTSFRIGIARASRGSQSLWRLMKRYVKMKRRTSHPPRLCQTFKSFGSGKNNAKPQTFGILSTQRELAKNNVLSQHHDKVRLLNCLPSFTTYPSGEDRHQKERPMY